MAGLDFCFRPKEPLTFGEWGNMVKVFTLHVRPTMSCILHPWQLLFMILAGWVNRQQQTLVAKKWDYRERRQSVGRPRVHPEIVDLVIRFARENMTWGYDKIQGALANLGHTISAQTVGNVLKAHGIEPAPDRKRQTTWKTFLKAHWDCLAAIDFTTIEVWTTGGLVTYYVLFVLEVATRRVHFAGCTPNLNPHIERFIRSVKDESLSRRIFFGESMLRNAVRQYLVHDHRERDHQGLDNRLIEPGDEVGRRDGEIQCRDRLGGVLRYYYRDAA